MQHLGRSETAITACPQGVAVDVAGVHQQIGAEVGKRAAVAPNARCRYAKGCACTQAASEVTWYRHQRAGQAGQCGCARGRITRIGVTQGPPIGGDAVGTDIGRRFKAGGGGDGNELINIVVLISDVQVQAVQTIGNHAHAAHHAAGLVQRQAARVGRQAQGRPFGAEVTIACAAHQVGARKLRELHAKKWPRWLVFFQRVEVFLHDLAGRAAGKSIARAGQISPGDGFADRRQGCGGQDNTVQATHDTALAVDAKAKCRSCHGVHRQHIAHTVGHRNGGALAASLRGEHGLHHDALNLAGRQRIQCAIGSAVSRAQA